MKDHFHTRSVRVTSHDMSGVRRSERDATRVATHASDLLQQIDTEHHLNEATNDGSQAAAQNAASSVANSSSSNNGKPTDAEEAQPRESRRSRSASSASARGATHSASSLLQQRRAPDLRDGHGQRLDHALDNIRQQEERIRELEDIVRNLRTRKQPLDIDQDHAASFWKQPAWGDEEQAAADEYGQLPRNMTRAPEAPAVLASKAGRMNNVANKIKTNIDQTLTTLRTAYGALYEMDNGDANKAYAAMENTVKMLSALARSMQQTRLFALGLGALNDTHLAETMVTGNHEDMNQDVQVLKNALELKRLLDTARNNNGTGFNGRGRQQQQQQQQHWNKKKTDEGKPGQNKARGDRSPFRDKRDSQGTAAAASSSSTGSA